MYVRNTIRVCRIFKLFSIFLAPFLYNKNLRGKNKKPHEEIMY